MNQSSAGQSESRPILSHVPPLYVPSSPVPLVNFFLIPSCPVPRHICPVPPRPVSSYLAIFLSRSTDHFFSKISPFVKSCLVVTPSRLYSTNFFSSSHWYLGHERDIQTSG